MLLCLIQIKPHTLPARLAAALRKLKSKRNFVDETLRYTFSDNTTQWIIVDKSEHR